jgi:hypothetical protein
MHRRHQRSVSTRQRRRSAPAWLDTWAAVISRPLPLVASNGPGAAATGVLSFPVPRLYRLSTPSSSSGVRPRPRRLRLSASVPRCRRLAAVRRGAFAASSGSQSRSSGRSAGEDLSCLESSGLASRPSDSGWRRDRPRPPGSRLAPRRCASIESLFGRLAGRFATSLAGAVADEIEARLESRIRMSALRAMDR